MEPAFIEKMEINMLPEEGWKPLKLRAEDDEDIEVFSDCLYGSLVSLKEMMFIKNKKSFFMTLERFTWEISEGKDSQLRKVLAILCFYNVNLVDIKVNDKSKASLLSIETLVYDKKNFILIFDNKKLINIKINKLYCTLEDIGKPVWPAVVPVHLKKYSK